MLMPKCQSFVMEGVILPSIGSRTYKILLPLGLAISRVNGYRKHNVCIQMDQVAV